jgi:hypothetical protein
MTAADPVHPELQAWRERTGRPTRIGYDEPDPQCLANYRALYPERGGTACNSEHFSSTRLPSRQHRGFGDSLRYRFSRDIR